MDTELFDPARFALDGVMPERVAAPETAQEAARLLAEAADLNRGVVVWGGGVGIGAGRLPKRYHTALVSRRLNRIIDFRPEDMMVTVEAGVTLADLNRALAEKGHFLPWNPPDAERATLGGIVATNAAGGLRFGSGTPRDRLLELHAALPDGSIIKGGAKVVKSVAGYDIPRLFCGSWGTLGFITEVTLKTSPLPEARAVWAAHCPETQLEALLVKLMGSPLDPERIDWVRTDVIAPSLVVEFSGGREAVEWQTEQLRAIVGTLGEGPQIDDIPSADWALGMRIATRSSDVQSIVERLPGAALLVHAGSGIVQAFSNDTADLARFISAADGRKALFTHLPAELKAEHDPWQEGGSPVELMRRVKAAFDPKGIMASGRAMV